MKFELDNNKMHAAAKHHLLWLCEACNIPYGIVPESEPYDLLVDFGKGWKKVQIKSSWYKKPSGSLEFSLRRTRNNAVRTIRKFYSSDEVDYFYLYNYNISWMIPFRELDGFGRLAPGNRYDEYLLDMPGWRNRQTQ